MAAFAKQWFERLAFQQGDGEVVGGVLGLSLGDAPAEAEAALSAQERARMRAFKHPLRAREFVAGRFLAKQVLARFSPGSEPAQWALRPGHWGQPVVLGPCAGLGVSLSHCRQDGQLCVAALAFDLGTPMGLDLERRRQASDASVAKRLTPRERELVCAEDGLAVLWSAKEAVAKACGLGVFRTSDLLRLRAFESLDSDAWHLGFEPLSAWHSLVWSAQGRYLALALPEPLSWDAPQNPLTRLA